MESHAHERVDVVEVAGAGGVVVDFVVESVNFPEEQAPVMPASGLDEAGTRGAKLIAYGHEYPFSLMLLR